MASWGRCRIVPTPAQRRRGPRCTGVSSFKRLTGKPRGLHMFPKNTVMCLSLPPESPSARLFQRPNFTAMRFTSCASPRLAAHSFDFSDFLEITLIDTTHQLWPHPAPPLPRELKRQRYASKPTSAVLPRLVFSYNLTTKRPSRSTSLHPPSVSV